MAGPFVKKSIFLFIVHLQVGFEWIYRDMIGELGLLASKVATLAALLAAKLEM